LNIKQIIKIRASGGSVVQDIKNPATIQNGVSKSQLADAVGKFKISISKLPHTPPMPPDSTSIKRPIIVVIADTLEQAPQSVIDWLRQLAGKMFNEYLLFLAAGQERIDGILETALDRVEDSVIKSILTTRYGISNMETIR